MARKVLKRATGVEKRERKVEQSRPRRSDSNRPAPDKLGELEKKMVEKGVEKYGLDPSTAQEWAHAFCHPELVEVEQ